MQEIPANIVNRALDAIGAGEVIGSMVDGTRASEAARRIYGPTLRQLLRAAHWSFARKQASLLLLGDASGQTTDPGTGQAYSTNVEAPWIYAYAWPNDGVAARWLPWNMTPAGTSVPISSALAMAPAYPYQRPGRFLVSSTDQFPAVVGSVDWDNLPEFGEGEGPTSRRIILTNMPNAGLVYTKLTLAIEEWDPLFAEAMVATLGSRLALPVLTDRKVAMAERAAQVAIAKDAVRAARVANANDAGFPQGTNRDASWIRARGYGSSWNGWDTGPGVLCYGWEAVSWADGSVF